MHFISRYGKETKHTTTNHKHYHDVCGCVCVCHLYEAKIRWQHIQDLQLFSLPSALNQQRIFEASICCDGNLSAGSCDLCTSFNFCICPFHEPTELTVLVVNHSQDESSHSCLSFLPWQKLSVYLFLVSSHHNILRMWLNGYKYSVKTVFLSISCRILCTLNWSFCKSLLKYTKSSLFFNLYFQFSTIRKSINKIENQHVLVNVDLRCKSM